MELHENAPNISTFLPNMPELEKIELYTIDGRVVEIDFKVNPRLKSIAFEVEDFDYESLIIKNYEDQHLDLFCINANQLAEDLMMRMCERSKLLQIHTTSVKLPVLADKMKMILQNSDDYQILRIQHFFLMLGLFKGLNTLYISTDNPFFEHDLVQYLQEINISELVSQFFHKLSHFRFVITPANGSTHFSCDEWNSYFETINLDKTAIPFNEELKNELREQLRGDDKDLLCFFESENLSSTTQIAVNEVLAGVNQEIDLAIDEIAANWGENEIVEIPAAPINIQDLQNAEGAIALGNGLFEFPAGTTIQLVGLPQIQQE